MSQEDISAMLHASGAPLSSTTFNSSNDLIGTTTTTTPALSSRLPTQPQHKRQRYSSRSNSVSGSSVATVQRVASRSSSRNGSSYPLRSQSPAETPLHALRLAGNGHARRRSVAVDPSDRSSSGNLENRWSQSTDSSLASSRKHHRASSGILLGNSQPLSPQRRPVAPDQSPRISEQYTQVPKSRQRAISPVEALERPWMSASRPTSRGNQLTNLSNLQTGNVPRSERSDSNSTASTGVLVNSASVTPSTHSSYAPEYFGSINASPRSTAKAPRPQTARTTTAPSISLNYSRMPRAEDVKESAHMRRQSEMINMERDARASKTPTEEKRNHAKPKDRAEKEKKAMLSKALEKANTAVVLDNRQNFSGALDAYMDACKLLQQVMDRSVNAADRRKLDAIKITYSTRIEELRLLQGAMTTELEEKGLPERPLSDDSLVNQSRTMSPVDGHLHESAFVGTAVETRLRDAPQLSYATSDRDSFFSRTMADVEKASRVQSDSTFGNEQEEHQRDGRLHIINQRISKLPAPEETRYLPAPLGFKKSSSPVAPEFPREMTKPSLAQPFHIESMHPNDTTGLDTISESRSSRSSSVHSVSSQTGLRRKPIQGTDDLGNAELDAAFDAAVEAAYDEGLEPDFEHKPDVPVVSHTRTKSTAPSHLDVKEIVSPTAETFGAGSTFMMTTEDDEEERILDEFTQDYGHGFNFAFGTKSALPRQSDSSGYSRSTWQSSQASERLTAGTSLSTVAENDFGGHRGLPMKPHLPNISPVSPVNLDMLPPSAPPPSTTLPTPPVPNQLSGSTVRHRRLSGQNARELKIETSGDLQGRQRATTFHNAPHGLNEIDDSDTDTHKEVMVAADLDASPSDAAHEHMLKSPPSLDILSTFAPQERVSTPLETSRSDDTFGHSLPSRPTLVRKNPSSLSLRADHTVLLPSPGLHEMGEPTPLSATFTIAKNKMGHDALTSQRVAFSSYTSPAVNAGGHYLFDTSLTAGRQHPTSPLQSPVEIPLGLEPCPESFLLRPFWLMRCIASTITHPRGGYVTTKLFVPREVWQTRGVKLKSVEEKVANCDLLTAALGQLSQVDTLDADAVMDELQRFDEVMERVQSVLVKKLGSEVGVHGVSALFRDAPPPSSASSVVGSDRGSETLSGTTDKSSKSHSSKGYLSSWRKLRSKSSGAPVGHSATFHTGIRTGDKDLHAMSSVPITSFVPVERRGQKRDVRNMSFEGPNKDYMGSLARLFQSVQVLDQIARQVEDPGLKHSSSTHVGLELSIRHAAEFFSFYICRFVLADMGMMIDKFIKRGTEWVMA